MAPGGSAPEEGEIDPGEASPLDGEVIVEIDSLYGALDDAQAAVDAGGGVDVQLRLGLEVRLVLGGVDAVDRADGDARGVLGVDARFSNDMGHGGSSGAGATGSDDMRRRNNRGRRTGVLDCDSR